MTAIEVAPRATVVDEFHRVERGEERIEEKLARGGARVCRVPA